jgi:hypothetical protein
MERMGGDTPATVPPTTSRNVPGERNGSERSEVASVATRKPPASSGRREGNTLGRWPDTIPYLRDAAFGETSEGGALSNE